MPVVGGCDTIFSHWAFRSWHTRGAIGMGLLSPSSQAPRNAAKTRSRNSYPLSFPPHYRILLFSADEIRTCLSKLFFLTLRSSFKKTIRVYRYIRRFFFSSFWQYKHKHFSPFCVRALLLLCRRRRRVAQTVIG